MNHQSYLLLDAPNGEPLLRLQCGPFRIIDTRSGHARLAQLRYGIELTGWVAAAHLRPRAAGTGCYLRSAPSGRVCRPRIWSGSPTLRPWPRARGQVVEAGDKPITTVGFGTALFNPRGGQKIGWLPEGSSVRVWTPRLVLAREDEPFPLDSATGWFSVGQVEVFGRVSSFRARLGGWFARAYKPPALPETTPPPTWVRVTPPREAGQKFIRRAFRKYTRLWLRTAEGPCRRLHLEKIGRRSVDVAHEGKPKIVWILRERHRTVERDRICVHDRDAIFDDQSAILVLKGHRVSRCRSIRGGGNLGFHSGSSAGVLLHVVGVQRSKAVLVPDIADAASRYAKEDERALFFSRAACEASTEPNVIFDG